MVGNTVRNAGSMNIAHAKGTFIKIYDSHWCFMIYDSHVITVPGSTSVTLDEKRRQLLVTKHRK